MAPELVLNVTLAGVLTGLVYGLMALGLSVIFGVVRVVNFAHGEMMTIAMYAATVLFAAFKLDPFLAVLPVALAFFLLGYAMQAGLINPFITRPEHSQFMLLVAVAIIMVNGLLLMFGPDARNVQVDYQLESYEVGRLLLDKARVFAAALAVLAAAALFAFFRFSLTGKAIRACADNYLGAKVVGLNVKKYYAFTFGLGSLCVAIAGCAMVLLVDVTPGLGRITRCLLSSSSSLAALARWAARSSAGC
jgi:branched-chain amino acid transport system permease protein